MHRRDLLRLLGGASLIAGLSPAELLAVGDATQRRLRMAPSPLGFFDSHQMHTVAAAGERILPATDTPGAMAAECHRFTELIVAGHYPAERQRRFVAGLVDLDRRATAAHDRLLVELAPVEQDGVLAGLEADAYAAAPAGADSFWRDLKQLTLYGYYTSVIGIEEELRPTRVHAHFDGCLPIAGGPQ